MNDKKVLICLPSLSCGDGIANVIMNNYEILINNGYKIDFLLVLNKKKKKEYLNMIQYNNGKIYELPKHSKFNKFMTMFNYLKKYIKIEEYDIIHMNLIERYALSGLLAFYLYNKNAIRIYHIHNPKSKSKLGYLGNLLNHLAIILSNKLFASSNEAGKSMFRNNEYSIIPNIIDVEKFRFDNIKRNNIRSKFKIDSENILIGTIGRITEQKNPYFVIDVIEKCIKLNENIRYIWIGEGNLKKDIISYVRNKEIENKVIFIDNIDEVCDYYSALDVFILPSLYEGLGIVTIEAQASGVPVIVSNRFPIETNITDLINYLPIEKEDIEKWIDFILKISVERERQKYNDLIKKSVFGISNKNSFYNYY